MRWVGGTMTSTKSWHPETPKLWHVDWMLVSFTSWSVAVMSMGSPGQTVSAAGGKVRLTVNPVYIRLAKNVLLAGRVDHLPEAENLMVNPSMEEGRGEDAPVAPAADRKRSPAGDGKLPDLPRA